MKPEDKVEFNGFHLGGFRLIFTLNLHNQVFVAFHICLGGEGAAGFSEEVLLKLVRCASWGFRYSLYQVPSVVDVSISLCPLCLWGLCDFVFFCIWFCILETIFYHFWTSICF